MLLTLTQNARCQLVPPKRYRHVSSFQQAFVPRRTPHTCCNHPHMLPEVRPPAPPHAQVAMEGQQGSTTTCCTRCTIVAGSVLSIRHPPCTQKLYRRACCIPTCRTYHTAPGSNLSPSGPLPPFSAQIAVEVLQGPELDYSLLAGKWLLVYTTANDVLPILEVGEGGSGGGREGGGLREW